MDIDIDVRDNKQLFQLLEKYIVRASTIENDELKPHLVGVYFQTIPVDHMSGLSAIPYGAAEEWGYKKVDILNLNLLNQIQSREDINKMLDEEPDWTMLGCRETVSKLFHISKHYETISKIRPKSVEDLADVLALIRPNKKHLIDKYLEDKALVRKILYDKVDASDMRKSHAISYALNIVLQMNLLRREQDE